MISALSTPSPFKWRQFAPEIILAAVRWYLRYSLSLRDVEELLAERGLAVDHTTIWRWIVRYAPELERRLQPHRKPTNDSWRVDETYVRVKGQWVYFYRAVDSRGATIDFLLSDKRDMAAAKRFLQKVLQGESHPAPRVINTDQHAGYPPAIQALKQEGSLANGCEHRAVKYLNNVLDCRITERSSAGSKPAGTSVPLVVPPPSWRATKRCSAYVKAKSPQHREV
jgi:IS6 family transposase